MFLRVIFAVLFIVAGVFHFVLPWLYVAIMPPYLPSPFALVYISGLFEVAGGIGLLLGPTHHRVPVRRIAAWGLMALLVAVMPANVFMATHHEQFTQIPAWALWLRLPLQLPLIWWAWLYTRS